ncbi:MAG: Imidazolonepropionase [Candidatus Aminicenantes bacterium ADurb.Bin508]|nr:MAG: Imidazolonepropionase [Candidatus Aminicenantes bacterium ADurb.Bin508]
MGCVSAEHLLKVSDSGIAALAASSTVAVILPGVYFFLRTRSSAPVRKMIDSGVAVALGTDFNPGSSMIHRMLFALRLGVFLSEFRMEEAIAASTINGACAIGAQDSVGSLVPGKKMDLLVFDVPHYRELFYSPSLDPLEIVVKEGEILLKNGELLY